MANLWPSSRGVGRLVGRLEDYAVEFRRDGGVHVGLEPDFGPVFAGGSGAPNDEDHMFSWVCCRWTWAAVTGEIVARSAGVLSNVAEVGCLPASL
jgi:hypothetical protein